MRVTYHTGCKVITLTLPPGTTAQQAAELLDRAMDASLGYSPAEYAQRRIESNRRADEILRERSDAERKKKPRTKAG